MANETIVSRIAKWFSWIIPGASFTGASIYSIGHSEFILRLAALGSLVLIALWAIAWLVFRFLKIRPAGNARIVSPGMQIHLFFLGAIGALWFPFLLKPLQVQRVEIILDVSHRMADEFAPPGTTKFEAARAGVLEILEELEGQNLEVALRLIHSIEYGHCDLQPETSLAVDFTRDFNQIREVLSTLRPWASDKAPVVNAVDFSIRHYLDKRVFDQKFYLYSFIGGDDTCGKHLGAYLTLPIVTDNAVSTELFLIVLRGTDEEFTLGNLPNANLTYARSAEEVQQSVEIYNRQVLSPEPASTRLALNSGSSSTSTGTDTAYVEQLPIANTIRPNERLEEEPVAETLEPSEPDLPETKVPPPTATALPSPTRMSTHIPSATSAPPFVPMEAPHDTPTDEPIIAPTSTHTTVPPTITPTHTPSHTALVCESTRQALSGISYGGTVTIDTPASCSASHLPGTPIDTLGTYAGIPQGTVIWVFVYPPNGPYYPQSPNACSGSISPPPMQSAGNWSVPAYLGNVNDPPKPFDIVVTIVDQATSDWIGQRLHEDCANGLYDGISEAELSQRNVDEKTFITVWTR